MSVSPSKLHRDSLPSAIQSLLGSVRRLLRRNAAARGALGLSILLCLVFWITTTIDTGWFKIQRLELPVGLRAIFLAVFLPAFLWTIAARVLFPLLRRINDSELAVLLERHFPQFQDRLITAIESAEGRLPIDGPLALPMLERTTHEASSLAAGIDASEIFDLSRMKRLSVWAGALTFSVIGVGLLQPQIVTRWWNAFILCDEEYHTRTTSLGMVVVAEPGDRKIEFRSETEHLVYRHPAGADLELEIYVPDQGPSPGVDWSLPERVRVNVTRADGSTSSTFVTPSRAGGREFRFVVTRLNEPVEIDLLAGDFRTRRAYRVVIVNPPGIDSIRLKCSYPDYTGWNMVRETSLKVTGSEIQLPAGTSFELEGSANKPLKAVRIVSDYFEISGDSESSRVILRDGRSSQSMRKPLLSADGQRLNAEFFLSSADNSAVVGDSNEQDSTKSELLQIPSTANLRFFLHDRDDVMSVSPETLRVVSIPDKPPVIVVSSQGIDSAITRLAKIPVAGRIRDDYGLVSSGFEFLIDDETNWRARPFRATVQAGVQEFILERNAAESFELFDVQVLELTEGQTLSLSVVAVDGNPYPTPGITRSDPMLFRIVSVEELLSLLYTREIALRARFEEVIQNLDALHEDLAFHEEIASRSEASQGSSSDDDLASLATCAIRSGNSLRRQTNELAAISEGFKEVVAQLINNSVPPQQLAENMKASIVAPLDGAVADLIPPADRSLGAFRVAAEERGNCSEHVAQAKMQTQKVIISLRKILENVRDMAEFHEALRDLKAILDEQQKNLEETRKLQKNQLIEDILN